MTATSAYLNRPLRSEAEVQDTPDCPYHPSDPRRAAWFEGVIVGRKHPLRDTPELERQAALARITT